MATRSARDNKALNARHAEVLKAMLRRPENKTCADCKKNDPRWASTNLGCFMCIRCSGIHRSMGVHITRIKSIDLDTWTPEQVANVLRWGNKRANAYWEAHLRAGHVPADHKIESFIRSKYESRRWAMEGPIPEPETLDDDGDDDSNNNSNQVDTQPAAVPASASNNGSAPRRPSVSVTLGKTSAAPPVSTSINLLDGPPTSTRNQALANSTTKSNPAATNTKNTATTTSSGGGGGGGGLFDLDFSPSSTAAAAVATAPAARKDVKNDILSLFSVKPPQNSSFGVMNQQQQLGQNANNNPNGLNNQFGGLNLSGGGQNNGSNGLGGFTSPTNNNMMNSGTNFGFGGTSNNVTQGVGGGGLDIFGGGSSNPWGNSINQNSSSSSSQQQQQQQQNDPFGGFVGGGNSNSSTTTTNNFSSKDAFSDIWK